LNRIGPHLGVPIALPELQAVIGETPNLAARLQALAGNDEVVIPENTRRLIGNLFDYQSLDEVEVKGLAAPIVAFRVLRESPAGSRFEALRTGETPLVGREEEIELLGRRWAQAKSGAGRVVLISGEAGIGKSRLVEAFRESLEDEPYTRLRYFCSPHHQDSAFFLFIGQLERASGFGRDDTPSMRLAGRHFPEERLEMPLPHQAQTVLTIINRAGGYERALGRFGRVAHVRLDRAVLEAERHAPVAVL
jgi:AAA ATPase domain/Adenylate and Guanylate cyclase catalytic domain